MNNIYYNPESKSFSMSKVWRGLNHAGTAVGLAASGVGLYQGLRSLDDKVRFTVVYNTGVGPKQVTVRANGKVEAIDKFCKNSYNKNFRSTAKAFRLPEEDEDAAQYAEYLRSSGNRSNQVNNQSQQTAYNSPQSTGTKL